MHEKCIFKQKEGQQQINKTNYNIKENYKQLINLKLHTKEKKNNRKSKLIVSNI
jgi:hypothetical protein